MNKSNVNIGAGRCRDSETVALKLWFGLQRDIEDFELWFFPQRRRTLQVIFSAIVTLVCVLCFVAIALTQFEVEAYLEESGASKSTAFLIKGIVGGVLIPVNTFATPDERDYILRHSDAAWLLLQRTLLKRDFIAELQQSHPAIALAAPGERRCAVLPSLRGGVGLGAGAGAGCLLAEADFLAAGQGVSDELLDEMSSEVTPSDDGSATSSMPSNADQDMSITSKMSSHDVSLVRALSSGQQNFVLSDPTLPDNPIVFGSPGLYDLTGYVPGANHTTNSSRGPTLTPLARRYKSSKFLEVALVPLPTIAPAASS